MGAFTPPPLSALQPESTPKDPSKKSDSKAFTPPPLTALKPESHPETMSAAKSPGFIDRMKEIVLGNPHAPAGQTDTPIGRSVGISYEAPSEAHTGTADLPLARVSAAAPQNPESVAGGIAKGTAEFAESMTTAPNLLMMAGSGALGAASKVAKYLPRAVSAAFSADMLKNAYQQTPEVKAAIDRQDWPAAAAAITKAGLTAGMGIAAGVHAARGGEVIARPKEAAPEANLQAEASAKQLGAEPPEIRTPHMTELHAEAEKLRAENVALKAKQSPASQPPEVRKADPVASGNPAEVAKPAVAQPPETRAEEATKLPQDLAGAKPRYSSGQKQFTVQFESDADKAAYITAQKTRSKRDADYLKFAMDQTGLGEAAVRFRGHEIKRALKEQSASAESGSELRVSKTAGKSKTDPATTADPAGAKQAQPPEIRKSTAEALPEVDKKDIRQPAPKDTSVTLGSGLAALDPYLKDAWGEMRDMTLSRKRANEEIEKAKASPADMKFGRAVLENFVGERDWWAARVNQAMERVLKVVPDIKDREALSIMRENTPEDIQKYLDGTHPDFKDMSPDDLAAAHRNIDRMRPVLERVLSPTKAMQAVNPLFTKIAQDTINEGRKTGNLESRWTNEQYVPHILHPEGEGDLPKPYSDSLGRALGGKVGKYFSHAATRDYPTFMNAIVNNVKPKTLDIVDAFTTHGDSFATSRATHMLVNQLKDAGIGLMEGDRSKRPKGWVELAPHSEEFRSTRKWVEDGKAQSIKVPLVVPKYISEALRPITDPDYIGVVPGFKNMRGYQTYMKSVQLGISMFHAVTENYMALSNMGPKGWAKALAADRDSPEFRSAEQDFIADNGTTSVQGAVIEAFKHFKPGSIPSWSDIARRAPIAREMDAAIRKTSEFTFNNLQRKFKVTDYMLHKAAWLAKHPDATADQIHNAGKSIAKEINAVYGGLKTETLGFNRTSMEMARFLALAPDWLFSNVFNVKYALEGGPKAIASQAARAVGLGEKTPNSWEGSAGSDLARKFWTRQAVGGLAATQMLSLMYSGHLSKNITEVYYGKDAAGNDVYQNVFFKGASGDVINLVHNVHDYGMVEGSARTLASKLAGIPKAFLHLAENKDARGKPLVPKGMHPIASTVRAGESVAKELAPIPIGGSTTYDMMFGPDAWKYSAKEVITTLLAGTPPRHLAPEKPGKPELSVWEQIKTGDVHKVNHRPKQGQPPEVRR